MGIWHSFASAKPEGGDSSKVRTSNWNDDHIVTAFAFDGGVISPAQLTGNVNDYAPTGWNGAAQAKATVMRLTSDRLWRRITGVVGGTAGRVMGLKNVGDYPILIAPEDAGSVAANRFRLMAAVEVWPDECAWFIYDNTSLRWRCMALPIIGARYVDAEDLVDDFLFGSVESGELGDLKWGISGTVGTHVRIASTQNNPGIQRIVSGAASGNRASLHPTESATLGFCRVDQLRYLCFIARTQGGYTTVTHRWGFGTDAGSTTFGTDGLWVEGVAGTDTAWQIQNRGAGVSPAKRTSGVTITDQSFIKVEFYQRPSDSVWETYINETRVDVVAANAPAASALIVPNLSVTTNTTAARSIEVDFARLRVGRFSGQRWT